MRGQKQANLDRIVIAVCRPVLLPQVRGQKVHGGSTQLIEPLAVIVSLPLVRGQKDSDICVGGEGLGD